MKIAAGDYNRDGKDDILCLYPGSGGPGSNSILYTFLSNGTALGSATQRYESSAGVLLWNNCTLRAGDVNHDGYDDAIIQQDLGGNTTCLVVIKSPPATGNVAGYNARSGSVVRGGYTNSYGNYYLTNVPGGIYTAAVVKSGYYTSYFTVISIGGTTRGNQNHAISPRVASGTYRIVLTWGASPSDLDSHFTGPIYNSTSRFHIYFSNKTNYNGSTLMAQLDHDDTSSYGPETVALYHRLSGTYRYSVYNYSSGGQGTGLSASSAKVQVYTSSGLVATFNVPAGRTGGLWTVFEIRNGTIYPINTVANFSGGSSGVTSSKHK